MSTSRTGTVPTARAHARPDLLGVLEDQGYRMTLQRRRLVELLETKQGAFGPEELLAELPGVSRATVYRTVKVLLDANVICKTTMPDGSPRYTIDEQSHHHHVICVACGRVDEFRHSGIERLIRSLRADGLGEIVGHRLELFRRCGDCQDRV